jgi:hypothetical protein
MMQRLRCCVVIAAFFLSLVVQFGYAAEIQAPTQPKVKASKYAPLAAGSAWEYQLTIPKATQVPVAPYFIQPRGLLGSSATNGMLRRDAVTAKVSVKVIEASSPMVAKIDVTPELLALWFAVHTSEVRMAVGPAGTDIAGLEVQGVMKMNDPKTEPWILGTRLASFPVDEKQTVKMEGFLAEVGTTPLTVGAKKYAKTLHSRATGGDGQYTSKHVVESWLAEGIGLVKLLVSSVEGEPIYTLELTGYSVGK